MNRNFVFILFLLSTLNSIAQSTFSLTNFDTDTAQMKVGFSSEFQYNTTGVSNQFLSNFYQGNYIYPTIKDASLKRLKNISRMGADFNSGIYFSTKWNKMGNEKPYKLRFFTAITDREHFNGVFSKNLYQLLFYGNKQFENQTIKAGGLNFNVLRYQQIQLGLLLDNGLGKKLAIGVSFLNGEESQIVNINKLDVFTGQDGKEVAVNWEANSSQSNPNNKGFLKDNGYGISTDLMYQFSYKSDVSDKNYFRLEINDLGFINWYRKSIAMQTQDSIYFDGYEVVNILAVTDTLINNLSSDSLENRYIDSYTTQYTTYLPARFSITIQQQHTDKLFMNLGMTYRFNANYIPYLYVKESYQINNNLIAGVKVSYGGYGKIAVGIDVNYQLKNWMIYAGTNNLDGIIFAKRTSGLSAFVGLSKAF